MDETAESAELKHIQKRNLKTMKEIEEDKDK